ncbi:hypothetical protein DL766_003309 [Monosporascus sp. MC13-8B]|uniref:Uncharacterized protein n=1 Tax=Monosporascus cannonballus TaxID=155416 RepID=A0ABY0HB30_9PEZI|nr:hypothetical protein DL763_006532 [Monosporascus cannonballus]RYO87283.1 hypothetical protein DL762_004328 [Monosporascus cannonballus]RYP33720.1 hypothetical protein DL766_003309 [Monosporascus sp. MC13-8B]
MKSPTNACLTSRTSIHLYPPSSNPPSQPGAPAAGTGLPASRRRAAVSAPRVPRRQQTVLGVVGREHVTQIEEGASDGDGVVLAVHAPSPLPVSPGLRAVRVLPVRRRREAHRGAVGDGGLDTNPARTREQQLRRRRERRHVAHRRRKPVSQHLAVAKRRAERVVGREAAAVHVEVEQEQLFAAWTVGPFQTALSLSVFVPFPQPPWVTPALRGGWLHEDADLEVPHYTRGGA